MKQEQQNSKKDYKYIFLKIIFCIQLPTDIILN